MRDVRRRERLAGLKRVSRRERLAGKAVVRPNFEDPPSERALPTRLANPSSEPKLLMGRGPPCDLAKNKGKQQQQPDRRCASHPISTSSITIPLSFPTSWLVDPFSTLPGASDVPIIITRLVFHWGTVFVPMTFPKEHTFNERAKTDMAVQSSFTDQGSFFGLMSMCAAHRAVLAGQHSQFLAASEAPHRLLHDTDYYIMKARCIREMNIKLCNPILSLSNEAFGTIINLLTGALIVGLFDEARVHLRGLKRMVDLRGGIADNSIYQSSMLAAILTTDVKAASGLMTQPVFPLARGLQTVSANIQERIAPSDTSKLQRLGVAFVSNPHLSFCLLSILRAMRDIILYGQACNQNPAVLCADDHEFFRSLNREVEHRLLTYVCSGSTTRCQVERPWFVERLSRVALVCGWHTWMQMSDVLIDYFYLPSTNQESWTSIWIEVMA
ncbi:tachykinin family protein [Aspergillus nomiae NRRL 13137]|uniref:Tachykinin family protein n=1 Tax=Aspergillus nomiae NRRL (strain ATCC 15546 / NRRL 13137 / CBS 260.88 / M93) TaxID=1509407 RepID=A0A0L1INK3_ASPN3|nr:tachykinin family protein [Aspergillus nomiae NRRL 13137]KNG80813.1 tachykinin family protein [Aspergillus nomiae NRRL 13137]